MKQINRKNNFNNVLIVLALLIFGFVVLGAVQKKQDTRSSAATGVTYQTCTGKDLTGKVLMLLDVVKVKGEKQSDNIVVLKRAFRNIPGAVLMFKCEANAYDVLNADMIAILTEAKAAPKAKEGAK